MTLRKGYLYALILALGLLGWTEVWDAWHMPPKEETVQMEAPLSGETPWESADAVYECAMKAQELKVQVVSMHVAKDTLQGSLNFAGAREQLQTFYKWLESEGRFRQILSIQFKTADDAQSTLSVSYQL